MPDGNRAVRAWLGRLVATRPGLAARLRLFGLLILLVPLFAGLQYLVRAGGPRIEVRFVAQDVPILVPVERIVERVVERIVYVPVPVEGGPDAPPSPPPTVQPLGTPTPSGADPRGAGVPSAGGAGLPAEGGVSRSAGPPRLAPIVEPRPALATPRARSTPQLIVATEDRLGVHAEARRRTANDTRTSNGNEPVGATSSPPDESP